MRSRKAVAVIEFELSFLFAPPAPLVDERALAAVPLVDDALDRVRDMPRLRGDSAVRRGAGLAAHSEALLLHLSDEEVDRHSKNRRKIAVGHAVTEKVLRLAKLVAHLARNAHLQLVGILRNRNHGRPRRRLERRRSVNEP